MAVYPSGVFIDMSWFYGPGQFNKGEAYLKITNVRLIGDSTNGFFVVDFEILTKPGYAQPGDPYVSIDIANFCIEDTFNIGSSGTSGTSGESSGTSGTSGTGGTSGTSGTSWNDWNVFGTYNYEITIPDDMPITDWTEKDINNNYIYKPGAGEILLSHSSFIPSGVYPGTKKIAFSFWDNDVVTPGPSNSLFSFFANTLAITPYKHLYLKITSSTGNDSISKISEIDQVGTSDDGFFVLTYYDETGDVGYDISSIMFYDIPIPSSSGTSGISGTSSIIGRVVSHLEYTNQFGGGFMQSSYYKWTKAHHRLRGPMTVIMIGGGGAGGGGAYNSNTDFSISGGGGGAGASVSTLKFSVRDIGLANKYLVTDSEQMFSIRPHLFVPDEADIFVGRGARGGYASKIDGLDGEGNLHGYDTIFMGTWKFDNITYTSFDQPNNIVTPTKITKQQFIAPGGAGGGGGTSFDNISFDSTSDVVFTPGGAVESILDESGIVCYVGGPGGVGLSSKTHPQRFFGDIIPRNNSHHLPLAWNDRFNGVYNRPSPMAPAGGGGGGGYVSDILLSNGYTHADESGPGGKILKINALSLEENPFVNDPVNHASTFGTFFGFGGRGGNVQNNVLPESGIFYGGGGGGGGSSRINTAQDGADGGNGVCIIIESGRIF